MNRRVGQSRTRARFGGTTCIGVRGSENLCVDLGAKES